MEARMEEQPVTMRMPFAGIPTFLGAPILRDIHELDRVDIAVLGIPFDMATTNRPGARYGPRAIRDASLLYTYHRAGLFAGEHTHEPMVGLYDIEERKTILRGYRMIDCGDVPILPSEVDVSYQRITDASSVLFSHPPFPVFLGGDHAVTYPILRGYRGEPIHVVHFDTHLDLLDELDGARYTHGSPFRHVYHLPQVKGLTQIGIRGILNDEIFHREAESLGIQVITSYEIKARRLAGIQDRLPHHERIYISIDIDVFDPSIAPGTGTPEPGGLLYWEARQILKYLTEHNQVMGFDIVEVSPLYDPTGTTAHLAARVAIDILGYVLGNRDGDPAGVRDIKREALSRDN